MEMLAHRSRASLVVKAAFGSGEPSEVMNTFPLFGLSTRSGAVTWASLSTFTRNSRVPPSTSSGFAGPWSTLTRLSGLMRTIASTYLSRVV